MSQSAGNSSEAELTFLPGFRDLLEFAIFAALDRREETTLFR